MKVLVTGAAGFIGSQLCTRLLERGDEVVGLDNINDYYDVTLKHDRLKQFDGQTGFSFVRCALEDRDAVAALFASERFDAVVNLAAQAGVRYSIENPYAYIDSNLVGFLDILEGCRHNAIKHLVFASSSSVYGANAKIPFSEHDGADHPVSLYAATKRSNELMAHTYAHLYGFPVTGLRFFTVYGPWGRPDMAYFSFTRDILDGTPINVFNHGRMRRDFTYIDDIVEGVVRVLDRPPQPKRLRQGEVPDPATSSAPYRIYNIGNNNPVELGLFIEILEEKLGRKAIKNYLPMQPGDVTTTYATVDDLMQDVGFKPATALADGLERFVLWYKRYYSIK
ncbi:MAG: NAD-dependent epimerase [Desulfuromonadaceae bacterium]|nr:NAD-dependent epimerase [Desulfuromonadaceae bacterium]MDD5104808.1 NAD-dependent epimerase [Desulfuromonadaceae bacterium]